ncbi:MAG: hypothetical protein NTW87_12860 [Planctomycetota bacterium]|nr:hypothetical protein [Planctomycetota bacterium]
MVDEKTVLTGSPLNPPAGGAGPGSLSFGQKLLFQVPGIIIALLLAIGVSYLILDKVNSETEKKLEAAKNELADQNRKLGEDLKKVDAANKKTQEDLAAVKEEAARIEKERQKLADKLVDISKSIEKAVMDFGKFRETTEAVDTTQTKDIAATAKNLNELDTKVHYIEKNIKEKLDALATDINGLKSDTTGIKEAYKVLRADVTKTQEKAEITEKDLADLGDRARLFQLRVLAARAREAAEAARHMDLKTLLSRLDDVEDKK